MTNVNSEDGGVVLYALDDGSSDDYRRRAMALQDAHHLAAGATTALQAAALGELDRGRIEALSRAHSTAVDLARFLRELRGLR